MSDYSIEEEEEHDTIGEYTGDRNADNERHGYGVAVLPNGDVYRGHYHNGKRHGRGHYRFKKNSCRYTGEWQDGVKHGRGTFVYPDGSKYSGSWENDMRTGQGKYLFVNGNCYVGQWHEDRRQGIGQCYYKNDHCKYVGQWQDDHRHGTGVLEHRDHRYHGTWSNDVPVGAGYYVFGSNMVQEGEYELVNNVDEAEEQMTGSSVDIATAAVPVWRPSRLICGEAARVKISQLDEEMQRVSSDVSVGSVDNIPQIPAHLQVHAQDIDTQQSPDTEPAVDQDNTDN